MKLWQKLFKIRETAKTDSEEKNAVFKKRYQAFRHLLSAKNKTLYLIAELEKKFSTRSSFDELNIGQTLTPITNEVANIINQLNLLSNNKYPTLQEKLETIKKKIETLTDEPSKDKQVQGTVLSLISPPDSTVREDQKLNPDSCETYSDILFFSQQAARQEMFRLSEVSFYDLNNPRKLVAGIPLGAYVVDLGGGIKGEPKHLYPEHISSFPFRAFLNGLTAIKWPGPPPVDVKGFMGMIANTLTIPEEDMRQTGENSFFFIAGDYMNCCIRLGYHVSTVEAYTAANQDDNHLRIFFKGGGAGIERRLRRVRLITEVLKKLGFETIKISDDVFDAANTNVNKDTLGQKLEILGKLTAYTKQQDMAMYNDAVTDFYLKEFLDHHMHDE